MGRVLEREVMEGASESAAYNELDRLWGDVIFQGFAESALHMGVRKGRVLDVGTGPGRVAIRLARLNAQLAIQGIDLSASMLDVARRNIAEARLGNVEVRQGDAKKIPFDDGVFDLVICHNFLHQLPEPLDALREIVRVAKPSGAILVRDVRRLPEPAMSLMMPLWCLGYSDTLRRQTVDSFRAGLTLGEFKRLVAAAGMERASIDTQSLTHQTVSRPAVPYVAAPPVTLPRYSLATRAMKSLYVSIPSAGERRPQGA